MSNESLRLCVVTPTHSSATMGGAQYQIECLLEKLSLSGRYEIHYLARRISDIAHSDHYRLTGIASRSASSRLGFIADAPALLRKLRTIRPDVIYQRVACAYTGVSAYYARGGNARMLWHIAHDNDVTPGALPGAGNRLRHMLERRAIEYGIRHADHIIAQTQHQVDLLKQYYDRAADLIVRNFHPAPTEKIDKSGMFTVLWVANLKPWKNPEAFVRLASSLKDLESVRFIMIGGHSKYRGSVGHLDALLQSIDGTPNLSYVGQKNQDEVNDYLARSHVFVNTSLEEGFANTFIQAWMREVPVVSLHVNPDGVLDNEQVGIHARTEANLAQAIREFYADESTRREYAARAKAYAFKYHSTRNIELLRTLIDGNSVQSGSGLRDDGLKSLD